MASNRKLVVAVVIMIVIALSVITLAAKMFGEAKLVSPRGSNLQYPTIVVTQTVQPHTQLAWDCPGCPVG